MLFNGRMLIFTFSRTQVRIAEIERLQSLFKTSMGTVEAEHSMWRHIHPLRPYTAVYARTCLTRAGQVDDTR